MTTKPKSKPPATAAGTWHSAIDPISAFCDQVRGAKTSILNEMNSTPPERGKAWNRQQVESYLNRNRKKRKEPRLGAGLVLIKAAKKVIGENTEDKARP